VRAWLQAHSLAGFYALTLVLSWTYWLTLVALGQRVEPGSAATHLPGLLGPAVAAAVVTVLLGGGAGLRELFARVVRFRAPRWR